MGLVVASPPALDGVGTIGNLTNEERRRVDDSKLRFAELSVEARARVSISIWSLGTSRCSSHPYETSLTTDIMGFADPAHQSVTRPERPASA